MYLHNDEDEFDGATGSSFDHQVIVALQKIRAARLSEHLRAQYVAAQQSMPAIVGHDLPPNGGPPWGQ